jgi:hypothetical protein
MRSQPCITGTFIAIARVFLTKKSTAPAVFQILQSVSLLDRIESMIGVWLFFFVRHFPAIGSIALTKNIQDDNESGVRITMI